MTQKTRSALEAEINSQITTNGTGAITGAILNSILLDVCDSANVTLTDNTSGAPLALAGGATIANGQAITTDTTTAHTALIQAYSTNAAAYQSLGTLTNGAIANLTLQPTGANGTVTMFDVIDQDYKRCTSTLTATSSTVLATATGLSIALNIGTYYIRGHLQGAAAASGGIKAELVASSGLVLSAAEITGVNYNGVTTNARTSVTALAADFANSNAAYTDVEFEGTIVVSTAGTINLQAAQNTSNGTSTTVLAGSSMFVKRIA